MKVIFKIDGKEDKVEFLPAGYPIPLPNEEVSFPDSDEMYKVQKRIFDFGEFSESTGVTIWLTK